MIHSYLLEHLNTSTFRNVFCIQIVTASVRAAFSGRIACTIRGTTKLVTIIVSRITCAFCGPWASFRNIAPIQLTPILCATKVARHACRILRSCRSQIPSITIGPIVTNSKSLTRTISEKKNILHSK